MSRSTRVLFYSLLFLLAAGALVKVSRNVRAAGNPLATITVRSSADAGGTCPGATCTLRQAIATAGSGDTIDFDLTTVTSPITLASELAIDKSLTIQGPGASLLTLSGNNAVRVFNIGSVTPAINVAISGLTIANGRHRGVDGNQGSNGFGGGILNDSTGTLSLNNVTLTGNQAIGGDSSNPNISGSAGVGGGLYNQSTGIVSITSSTISGNLARSGIARRPSGSAGGAIYNVSGTVHLTNSTVSGNTATSPDLQSGQPSPTCQLAGTGGSDFILGSLAGGIYNGGTLNLTNSTLSGNSANGGTITNYGGGSGAIIYFSSGSFGGGIYNSGTAKITNSTLFGNSSNGVVYAGPCRSDGINAGGGGAVFNNGQITFTNSTVSGNSATGVTGVNGGSSGLSGGGGVNNTDGEVVNSKNTILAGNSDALGPDFYGTLTSQGWNLIGNNKDATITPAPGTADQIGTDAAPINPLLGPLANNGGPTFTMALLAGSPARDKGAAATDPISGTPITTDQRGFVRPSDDPAIANATGGDGSDIGAFEAQVQAGPPIVAKAFSPATISVGSTSLLTITLSNAGSTVTGASLTDTLPAGLATVGGTAVTACGGTATQTANAVTLSGGTIPAGGSCTLSVTVTSTTIGVYTNTITAGALTTANGGANAASASASLTVVAVPVGSPVGPGNVYPETADVSDQKAGSVLIYNIYTSATDPTRQNTRLSLTNTNPSRGIAVHLFFVDGSSCSVADSYLCLTQNQTTSFLASDLDPGTTGYVAAVAVDAAGCPANFNFLVGDVYVKFSSGHAANLGAEAFSAILGGLPACNTNTVTTTLNFDGISYNPAPRVLALDNVGSRADGNDTLLILNRIGGNLATGASTLGTVFGILYDDSESGLSFSVTGSCQLRNSLSNTFPRTTPRFDNFIPAGRSGWLKLFSQSDIGLTGSAINFNANAGTTAGAFGQGHNLHKLTLTAAASYTIPVFPPGC